MMIAIVRQHPAMTACMVVRANLSDAEHGEFILRLLDEYARDPMGGGQPLAPFVRKNLLKNARQQPTFGVFIGSVAGVPAGLLTFVRGFSTFAAAPTIAIHDLIVSREFRRQGLGRALLGEAEKEAVASSCCKLTLEVLSGNAPAMAAYRGCGFEGYQLDPEKGNALFWQKNL